MKNFLLLVFAVLSLPIANAQEKIKASVISAAYPIGITTAKTTMLLFPAPIEDADRGNADILAERVSNVSNMLKVKAATADFEPGNLHVITKDGRVYSFSVQYDPEPAQLTIDVAKIPYSSKATFGGVSLNEREIEDYAATVIGSTPFIKGVDKKKHDIKMKLDAIFIKDDVLFFRYNLKNGSNIGYNAYPPRFFVRDKKRAKRTAIQDSEVLPVYIQHRGAAEDAAGQTIVVAFRKFTIAENKLLVASFNEQDGDRNLECDLSQKKLLKAKSFSY